MELILHHYPISPYAEKIRLVFGLKRLAWHSVEQPMVLPKPDLVPLTGGYRRIPVLQIGADVFCDTNLIADVLERLHPAPTLFPGDSRAETGMWCSWAERVLMWPTARYVTGVNNDRLGESFHADRAAMRGHPAPTADAIASAVPYQREQCRIMLGWLDGIFRDGRLFLLGDEPGLADFAVYQRIWWLHAFDGRATDVLDGFGCVVAWEARVRGIGHGERRQMEPAQALQLARHASPDPSLRGDGGAPAPAPGERIVIGTEGHAPDAVTGTVVGATADAITLERDDPELGRIAVHFPRLGYEWHRA